MEVSLDSRPDSLDRGPDWLDLVSEAESECFASGRFQVQGLEVSLKAADHALIRWVLKYLQPLSLDTQETHRRKYSVTCLFSDEIVVEACRHMADWETIPRREIKRRRVVKRARPSADIVVYCDPHEGVFWLSDLAANAVYVVVSSRTRWPALEFARITRTLVTYHLEEQGWTLHHAAAVNTPNGAFMIPGDPGTGKTSLLLALLSSKVQYISNEWLFIREVPGGFQVLGYPMAVAIGLGTALQFPGLADLIEAPDRLQYPRRRLSSRRLLKTPRNNWSKLSDKLQVLPCELDAFLGPVGVAPGGNLHALVFPMMSKESQNVAVQRLDPGFVLKSLRNNFIGRATDSGYPPWVEMSFSKNPMDAKDASIERLSQVDAVGVSFGLSLGDFKGMDTTVDRLLDAVRKAEASR